MTDQYAAINTYEDLADFAIKNLKKRGQKELYQVCGPISTGGLGDKDANIKMFLFTIQALLSSGYSVFNQIPYENAMMRIWKMREEKKKFQGYDLDLLTKFYHPIFNSGYIGCVVFMPGYESSTGAMWEKSTTEHMQINQLFLVDDWFEVYQKTGTLEFKENEDAKRCG